MIQSPTEQKDLYAYHNIFAAALGVDLDLFQTRDMTTSEKKLRYLLRAKIIYAVALRPDAKENKEIAKKIEDKIETFDEEMEKMNIEQMFYFCTEKQRIANLTPNFSNDLTPHQSYYAIEAALRDTKV